jgi:hypothetical protein
MNLRKTVPQVPQTNIVQIITKTITKISLRTKKERTKTMMLKKIAGTIAAIAAAAMMTTTAFAGEWVTLNDGRKYYNTGYDDQYHGW